MALTGLAGCTDGSATERADVDEGDVETTVDEGTELPTDDVEETSSGSDAVAAHDHSGPDAGGGALAPESVQASSVRSDGVTSAEGYYVWNANDWTFETLVTF